MAKSFIESTDDVVRRALRGLIRSTSHLAMDPAEKVVFRRSLHDAATAPNVVVLSGGGSGHEPAHAGFVGQGMLDVAVMGNIFASPSASQIFKALKAFPSEKGALIIVKNYTGDALSFGLAAEKARAAGIKCELVIVGDDIAIAQKAGSTVGRRGLAGVTFVHKIAGAAAAQGKTLQEVYEIAQSVASNLATIGVSLQKCHVPGHVPESLENGSNETEIEYGMGIHNEPGAQRAPLSSMSEVVKNLLYRLLSEEGTGQTYIRFSRTDELAILVNNLGGLSLLELNVITGEVMAQLQSDYDLVPKRLIQGTFISSLNGLGFSLTLLKLESGTTELLDSSTEAVGWVPATCVDSPEVQTEMQLRLTSSAGEHKSLPLKVDASRFNAVLREISKAIKEAEPTVTHYDSIIGDGDCGETLLAGAKAIANALSRGEIDTSDLLGGLRTIANLVEANMGGTSGAIYGIYLNGLVSSFSRLRGDGDNVSVRLFAKAAHTALEELFKYTRARQGSRTMMDVLIPFIQQLSSEPAELAKALKAAQEGLDATKVMAATFGRASYVDSAIFEQEQIPDPGALGLLSILRAILKGLEA